MVNPFHRCTVDMSPTHCGRHLRTRFPESSRDASGGGGGKGDPEKVKGGEGIYSFKFQTIANAGNNIKRSNDKDSNTTTFPVPVHVI
jgi:hypothetical protein